MAWPGKLEESPTAAPGAEHGRGATRSEAHGPVVVSMESLDTPAAGLLLLWTADVLGVERYADAAIEVARACAAALEPSGKIRASPIFAATSGGPAARAAVIDRGSTRAGLVLLLECCRRQSPYEEFFRRAAARAASWLMTQQSPNGAWPTAWCGDGGPDHGDRILRLEDPDYRDSTLALALAAHVFGEPLHRRAVEHAVDCLLKCRLGDASRAAPSLWSMVYTIDGAIYRHVEFPVSIDLRASSYSLQTLLGVYMQLGYQPAADGLRNAVVDIGKLPRKDGLFSRLYDINYGAPRPTTRPAADEAIFSRVPRVPTPLERMQCAGVFGIEAIQDAASTIRALSRDEYCRSREGRFSLFRRQAAAVCGLEEPPLLDDLPENGRLDEYLRRHDADWRVADGGCPSALSTRTRRLWTLLVRARLASPSTPVFSPPIADPYSLSPYP